MSNSYNRKKIENYSYGLGDIIGKGYSSQVYKGRNDITNQNVAVKVIDLRMLKNDINKVLLQSQIKILKELKSLPNILTLHEVFTTKNNTYIITQLCDSDLSKLIKRGVSQSQACNYMQQIINGYLEFAKRQIVHRDLKPANILITETQELKVADFGFAIKLEDAAKSTKYNVGSPLYMAPQSLRRNQYTLKTDIWALGVIFFEILTGETPWKAKNQKDLLLKIQSQKIQDKLSKLSLSHSSKEFLKKCLKVDKIARMEVIHLNQLKFGVNNCDNVLGEKKLNFEVKRNNFNQLNVNLTAFTPKIEKSVQKNRSIIDKSTDKKLPIRDFSLNKFSNTFNNQSINQSLLLKPMINHKYSPSVNIDLNKKNMNKSTKQNPQNSISSNTHFISKGENRNQKKAISKILVCQIHFCRFLYKLMMRILESNKSGLLQHSKNEVDSILWNYTGIVKHKIQNILNFATNNFLNTSCYEEYRNCSDYQKLIKIAKEYKERYSNELKQYWNSSQCSFSTINTLSLITHLQKLLQLRQNNQQFINLYSKDIIIVDYLITSHQLIDLLKGQNYERFSKRSRIEDIVEGKIADISRELYVKIMNRAKQVVNVPVMPCLQVEFDRKDFLKA